MRDTVRFLLGNDLVEEHDIDPTMTVLEYLRTVVRKTGTKEGCAEGDCGACTVVVGELIHGRVQYRALNACILFLPTVDGKQLLTVEHVGSSNALHPVQRAMVDCHGSQCGFCTPGFIMSLYSMYLNGCTPDRRSIDVALAGNLCRCTGYDSIAEAAIKALANAGSHPEASDVARRLMEIQPREELRLRFRGRSFAAPLSVDSMARLVADRPESTIVTGGTDVGLWVTKQHRVLDNVIYAGRVDELKKILVSEDSVEIGAAVPLSDAMDVLVDCFPWLRELLRRFGSAQIRNAGTLGGNIANASPIGDSMPPLLVLGAVLNTRRGETTRELPIDEFFIEYQETALQPGEFIQSVRIPRDDSRRCRVYKISKRRDQDISVLCGAFALQIHEDTIVDARVAFGGMAAIPSRAPGCERALVGQPFTMDTMQRAGSELVRDFTPITDMRASAEYRMIVARNLLKRFYHDVRGEPVSVFDYENAGV